MTFEQFQATRTSASLRWNGFTYDTDHHEARGLITLKPDGRFEVKGIGITDYVALAEAERCLFNLFVAQGEISETKAPTPRVVLELMNQELSERRATLKKAINGHASLTTIANLAVSAEILESCIDLTEQFGDNAQATKADIEATIEQIIQLQAEDLAEREIQFSFLNKI